MESALPADYTTQTYVDNTRISATAMENLITRVKAARLLGARTQVLDLRRILPPLEELQSMGRRRYQHPSVERTERKNRADDEWYIRYRIGVLRNGEEVRVEQTEYLGKCREVGKREAEKKRDDFLEQIVNRPAENLRSQVGFAWLVEQYLKHAELAVGSHTLESYKSTINTHIVPRWGKSRLCDITPAGAQEWLLQIGRTMAKGSARQVKAKFAQIWKYARFCGYTRDATPTEGTKLGKQTGRPARQKTLPTVKEFNTYLGSLEAPFRDIVTVAAFTGLRISEVLALRWQDLLQDNLLVRFTADQRGRIRELTKTDKSHRVVPIGHVRRELLSTRPLAAQVSAVCFPMVYMTVHRALKAAAESVGIDYPGFGCHTFRRFHNTHFRRMASVEDAMEQLGHANKATNDLYMVEGDVDVERRAKITARMMGAVTGRVV